jgi:glycine cleavage system regulatory protein
MRPFIVLARPEVSGKLEQNHRVREEFLMKTHLMITVTCPDRPGIVEQITEVTQRFSANWEDSRMARLGGDFAGIVEVSVAPDRAEALAEAFRDLADDQMTVVIKITQPVTPDSHEGHAFYDLRLTGADNEGIVHTVSGYLASRGINVESMETEVNRAPMSATPLFQMRAQIKAPPGASLSELSANLQRIGDELGVDIEVSPGQR